MVGGYIVGDGLSVRPEVVRGDPGLTSDVSVLVMVEGLLVCTEVVGARPWSMSRVEGERLDMAVGGTALGGW